MVKSEGGKQENQRKGTKRNKEAKEGFKREQVGEDVKMRVREGEDEIGKKGRRGRKREGYGDGAKERDG